MAQVVEHLPSPESKTSVLQKQKDNIKEERKQKQKYIYRFKSFFKRQVIFTCKLRSFLFFFQKFCIER
jgi:hypothetical protein